MDGRELERPRHFIWRWRIMAYKIWTGLAILWFVLGMVQTIIGATLYGVLDIIVGAVFLVLARIDADE